MELTEQQIREKLAEKAKARGQVLPAAQASGTSLIEKYGFAKSSTPAAAPSLKDRLGNIVGATANFGKELGQELIEAPGKLGETAIQSLDTIAKPAGEFLARQIKDTPLEAPLKATKPFVEAVSEPQFDTIQTAKEGAGDVIKTAATVAPIGRAASFIKNLGEAAAVGGLYNFGSAVEEDKGLADTVFDTAQGVLTVGGIVGGLGLLGKGAEKLLTPAETLVKNKITELYNKAIKPTIAGKGTVGQVEKYQDNVLSGVQSIIENKPNLKFTDEFGEVIQGESPKSLSQAAEAIDQTKKKIFEEYDRLAKQAGESGATVPTKPVIDELATIINNKSVALANPKAITYAKELIDRLAQKDAKGNIIGYETLTPSEAQDVVQHLNQSLQAFYKNPTYDTATQAGIDALFANKLRTGLDESISNLSSGYQGLKNEYGALSSIEKDVVKASLRDARKNIKGLVDFSDVLSGGELISGILSMNPASIAKAGAMKGISEYIKYLNNPNRIISKVFQNAGKLPPRIRPTPGALQEMGQKVPNQSPSTNLLSKNPSPTNTTIDNINNISTNIPQKLTSVVDDVENLAAESKFYEELIAQQNGKFLDVPEAVKLERKAELSKRLEDLEIEKSQREIMKQINQDAADSFDSFTDIDTAAYGRMKSAGATDVEAGNSRVGKQIERLASNKMYNDEAMELTDKVISLRKKARESAGIQDINAEIKLVKEQIKELDGKTSSEGKKMSGFASVTKDIPKELQPLAEEAKKYKSAEAFINAQEGKYYHGGEKIDEYKNIGEGGVYLTPDLEMADIHKKFINWKTKGERQGVINEGFVKPKKTLILNENQVDIIEAPYFYKKQITKIKKDGYDSIMSHDGKQLFVFDATQVKTKSQLKKIWKEANN